MPQGDHSLVETLVRQLPSGDSSGVFPIVYFSFVIVVVFVQPNTLCFGSSRQCRLVVRTVVLIQFLSGSLQVESPPKH